MNDHPQPSIEKLAESLREQFIHRSFGAMRFWRFAVVRPQDQSFELVSVHQEGERLDLVFVHASHQGLPCMLSVWAPEELSIAERGFVLGKAARLKLEESEAWSEAGGRYRMRTPLGEGSFDINGVNALSLDF